MSKGKTAGRRRARGELSRDRVLRAAARLVDAEGLPALSMRRLGAELGVEAMTLYHYVSGKEEVIDGMLELVVADAVGSAFPDEPDWRNALRGYAIGLRRALRSRPRMVPLLLTRTAITPAMMGMTETGLRPLTAAGFRADHALAMIRAITVLVLGNALDPTDPASVPSIELPRFPLTEAAFAAAHDAGSDEQFAFTLDCLLDGFAARLR